MVQHGLTRSRKAAEMLVALGRTYCMPELPEVETVQENVKKTSFG